MPSQLPNLDDAGKFAALAAGAVAIGAALFKPMRWAGKTYHRFMGELAFAPELARMRETADSVPRLERKIDNVAGQIDTVAASMERIESDVRLLFEKLIPEAAPRVIAPEHPLAPFPRPLVPERHK